MSTTNYDMSATATATIPSSEMSTLSSIYIPRVYANLSTEFVADTFESLNLGVVDRVEAVPRPGDKTTYMAFVYFASWNTENKAAVHLAQRINTPGGPQARIVYDDPWYWILLPNKSAKPSKSDDDKALEEFNRSNSCIPAQEIWEAEERRQKREKEEEELMEELEGLVEELEFEDALNKQELETEEKMDILFDMIEDLQVRLKVSEEKNQKNEKKIERLQKELCDVRTILLTGEATVDCCPPVPPVPPKLGEGLCVDTTRMATSVEMPTVLPEVAPELPALPFVVEPTHFHSDASVPVILTALVNSFSKNSVSFTSFCPNKCKFTCEQHYSNSDPAKFVVRIFSTPEHQLIEFQRRGSSSSSFCYAYDLVASELVDGEGVSIINASVPRSSQRFHQFNPRKRNPVTHCRVQEEERMSASVFEDMDIPSPPKLVRQTARGYRFDDDMLPPSPPKLVRQNAYVVGKRIRIDGMGLVNPSEDDKNFWCDP